MFHYVETNIGEFLLSVVRLAVLKLKLKVCTYIDYPAVDSLRLEICPEKQSLLKGFVRVKTKLARKKMVSYFSSSDKYASLV